jgi:hypothetical protein
MHLDFEHGLGTPQPLYTPQGLKKKKEKKREKKVTYPILAFMHGAPRTS